MKKLVCSDRNLKGWLHNIMRSMTKDGWKPDYIVGITRGGLIPATMLSQYLDIPMHTLGVSLRDGKSAPESNLWMAEDAFGYVDYEGNTFPAPADRVTSDVELRKKILLVDDINDTGATLNWIQQDWRSGCLPDDPAWETVWGSNVRVAVMIDNQASNFDGVDYAGQEINKKEDDVWVVFPWEQWWEN